MIVVAGGTGFIGNAITLELAGRGQEVCVLSHRAKQGPINGGSGIALRRADVQDRESLLHALAGADAVVGAVQFAGFPNENRRKGLTFDQVDRRGTENLVAAALQNGVKRYLYISGAGAAADAAQPWFRAKWGAETAVRASGMQYAIIRPSWVYGLRDNALNQYVKFVKGPLPLVPVIGNGRQRLQPVFVEDVARAVADLLLSPRSIGDTLEIGGPDVLSMDDVVRTVETVCGRRKRLVHAPVSLMKLLFSPKALFPALPIPLSPSGLEFATMDATANNGPLLAALPEFRLTSLSEGLATYLPSNLSSSGAL
jgi:NADH dehydrogenase